MCSWSLFLIFFERMTTNVTPSEMAQFNCHCLQTEGHSHSKSFVMCYITRQTIKSIFHSRRLAWQCTVQHHHDTAQSGSAAPLKKEVRINGVSCAYLQRFLSHVVPEVRVARDATRTSPGVWWRLTLSSTWATNNLCERARPRTFPITSSWSISACTTIRRSYANSWPCHLGRTRTSAMIHITLVKVWGCDAEVRDLEKVDHHTIQQEARGIRPKKVS